MKKLINISFVYFILAMVGGVFYREFTKYMDFSGRTTLAFVHVHLLVLGSIVYLILALFSINTDLLEQKKFKTFLRIYNVAMPLMVVMMVVRGLTQVLKSNLSGPISSAISGLAGITHILVALALTLLFLQLKNINIKNAIKSM